MGSRLQTTGGTWLPHSSTVVITLVTLGVSSWVYYKFIWAQQPRKGGSSSVDLTMHAIDEMAGKSDAGHQAASLSGSADTSAPVIVATTTAVASTVTLTDTSTCEACQALAGQYEKIAADFVASGFDVNGIRAVSRWFHGVHRDDGLPGNNTERDTNDDDRATTPWPRRYEHFLPEPLPPKSVRLLVIPLDGSPSLAAAGAQITKEILAVMPPATKVFSNARTHYHITVYHSSHPLDLRPDPFSPSGGVPPLSTSQEDKAAAAAGSSGGTSLSSSSVGRLPLPTESMLAEEARTIRGLVAGLAPPTLVVERVLMTVGGTVLITWVDPSGRVAELRRQLLGTFPGACKRQASIIHTSLLRVVTSEPSELPGREEVARVCDSWTKRLKGRTMVPPATWWVTEEEFSTIEGPREVMNFGPKASA